MINFARLTPPAVGIELATVLNHPIPNIQILELSLDERRQAQDYHRRFGSSVEPRGAACAQYNCHGMTFASRRTNVTLDEAVELIIEDDNYVKIDDGSIKPGDVALYFKGGRVEHSGIV